MTNRKTISETVPRITDEAFCAWLGRAAPNDRFVYHRGYLALDLNPVGQALPDAQRRALYRLARRAWWAAERDLVHLVQRRHGPEIYDYIAVARPKPKSAPASLRSLQLAEVA